MDKDLQFHTGFLCNRANFLQGEFSGQNNAGKTHAGKLQDSQ